MFEIKGSGSKPDKPHTPVEADNTLKSIAYGKIVDLLAYGPIKGLVDGRKSIFVDDTPIENEDGTANFEGISTEFRNGDPSQDIIPGFDEVSLNRAVQAEILFDSPVVRSLSNPKTNVVVVTIKVHALAKTEENGDMNPYSLPISISVKTGNGGWNGVITDTIRGKTTSPYQKSYRFSVPEGDALTTSVRVSRGTRESDKNVIRDAVSWDILTEVQEVKLSYPNCVLAGIKVDSSLFGNQMPSRKYLVDLSLIKVPSNYNPTTRAYTGIWDGTFKTAWSDNPAWCYYDLATHSHIGAGIKEVNKWALYEIAKYCDELVDDGFGGKEPRFTCNTLIAASEDAITALNNLASVFRGINYWGSNTIEVVADMPGPVRKILSPSDVIDGEFSYEGSSLRDRNSIAVVMWNDPSEGYKSIPERVEDPEAIELLGWKEVQINAVGCTSRGQARRLGLWALYSSRYETQTVAFSVTAKHSDLRPGDVIQISDPFVAGARFGGKIASTEGNKVTLDAAPAEVSVGWKITLEAKDTGLTQTIITEVADNVLTLSESVGSVTYAGATYLLSDSAVKPQTFRVVGVSEADGSVYQITASSHDPNKYDLIEKGLPLVDDPISFIPTGRLSPPTDVTLETYKYLSSDNGGESQGLVISWLRPINDARVDRYVLEVRGPNDLSFRTVYTGSAISFDLKDIGHGTWHARVKGDTPQWGSSPWAETSLVVQNMLLPKAPESLTFQTTFNSVTIRPITFVVGAEFEFWKSDQPVDLNLIEDNATYLGTGSFFVDTDLIYDTVYYYYVRGKNAYGQSNWVTGQAKTKADVDNILNSALDEYQESALGKWFAGEVDKISGNGIGSVNDRVDRVDRKVDTVRTDLSDLSTDLNASLNQLQSQMAEFTGAPEWSALEAYLEGALVQDEGKLFRANKDVPIGILTSNEEYWTKIGDFASLSEGVSDLAFRVQQAENKVIEIDGHITPIATELTALGARWREVDEDEDGDLVAALDAWDSTADFYEEVTTRANAVESLGKRITNLTSTFGEMQSSISSFEQVVSNEFESVATKIDTVSSEVGDNAAAITTEAQTRVSENEALSTRIDTVSSEVGDNAAAITTEAQTRVSENEALSTRIDTVSSEVGDNAAAITTEAQTRVSENEALSTRIDTVSSEVGDNAAAITAEAQTRVSENAAMAQQISEVRAELEGGEGTEGGLWAAVTENKTAVADLETGLSAQWGIKVAAGTGGSKYVSGIGLIIDDESGTPTSEFVINADTFTMVSSSKPGAGSSIPFKVEGGKFIINTALIGTASINMLHIGDNLQSDDYDPGIGNPANKRGWKLFKDGNFEINAHKAGQGRIEINQKGLRVYDKDGNIRVKIGDLT